MKRFVCLAVFLVAGAAWAQKPPAELKQLQPFVGTWSCKGTVYAGEWGPEHPTVFKIATKWGLDGMWLVTDYNETKTEKNPHPMKGLSLWGYNSETKKFVGGWVDNSGMYQTQESDGWKGNEIVFAGPTHGGGMPSMTGRDTFVKKSAHEVAHTFELDMKGTWKKVESDTCKM